MSKASTETFLLQINSGKIRTDKAKIYRYIRRNENTHKENIMRDLMMSHQTVTARLSDLQDMGVIEVVDVSVNQLTQSKVSRYKIQENEVKIKENIKARRIVKYNRWLKQGERFNDLKIA